MELSECCLLYTSHNRPKPVVEEEEDILEDLPTGTVAVTAPITVAGFCEQVGVSTSQVIMEMCIRDSCGSSLV